MKATIQLPVTKSELYNQSNTIALEALSVNLPNRQLLINLTGLVKDTASFVTKKVSSITAGISQSRRESYLSYRFVNKLNRVPYTDLMTITLPTPEGLQTTFLEYALFLNESQKTTARLYDDFLHPFSQWISSMIQRPESVEDLTNQIREFDFTAFDKAEAEFPKYITGINASKPYGQLIRNNQEWSEIEVLLKSMVETDRRQPRELVTKKVKDTTDLLNGLMIKMADPNGSYRPTSKVVKDLSELTFKLAEHVTFYSIIEAAIDALIVAVKDAKEATLREVAKK